MKSPPLPIILLNARPAAGKSELIDFLKRVPLAERQNRFHIHQFDVFDDFPILWSWFEEDALLEKMGHPRLHSDPDEYFTGQHLWHVLIKLLCLEYKKCLRDNPNYHASHTCVIEFSRGTKHGGYAKAYQHLCPEILAKAAILYINVSWEESLRKNRARFNPDRPDSILEHSLDDKKMSKLYREDDWLSLIDGGVPFLEIQGVKVPYAIFENEDDVTSAGNALMGDRLEQTLAILWQRYNALHP